MAKFPPTIQKLIDEFSCLPTIGPKTAERFVFYLLRHRGQVAALQLALEDLKNKVTVCSECLTFSEKSPCYICSNPKRNRQLLCVIANTTDLAAIENTGQYNGLYQILGGTIDALNENQNLNLNQLTERLKKENFTEIILAFNSDIDGESTILYLTKILKPLGSKISRLAKGLPMGGELIYADEVTLTNALEGRKEL